MKLSNNNRTRKERSKREKRGEEVGELNTLNIGEHETLSLDGIELRHVSEYSLKHSAGKPAELTLTLEVNVNQADFELVK